MGDLLEYFEVSNDGIDRLQAKSSSATSWNNNFSSCIHFNGTPILPPVMTQRRREEMLNYRRQAMKIENRRKSKQREELVAKVQSIVAEVEERRLARTSSNKPSPQSSSNTSSAKVSPDTNVSTKTVVTKDKKSASASNRTQIQSTKVKERTAKSNTRSEPITQQQKSKKSNRSTALKSSSSENIRNEHTAQVKQSSASKIPTPVQGQSLMNLKRSSSLSSLPNLFQVPKPPPIHITKQQQNMSNIHARRANLRASGQFSFSNPDLRDIGTDDERGISPTTVSESNSIKQGDSKSNLQSSLRQSVSNPDISKTGVPTGSEVYTKGSRDQYLTVPDPCTLYSSSHMNKTVQDNISPKSEQETDNKGSTLESLSDLTSLEDNSLPQDFNGMPLTTERQQKISHVLAKLSKCLNIQDTLSTLNSTSSNSLGFAADMDQPEKEMQPKTNKQREQQTKSLKKTSSGSSIDHRDSGGFVPNDSKSSHISVGSAHYSTPPSHNSSASEPGSVASSVGGHSRATNSSVMSSDSSVTGSHLGGSKRMSPKGSKSAVHFASFVTEINTSASLSVEDKILVRKMDITPTNSPQVSLDVSDISNLSEKQVYQQEKQVKTVPKNLNDLGSRVPQVTSQPNSMLDKVALSPDADSPSASREFFGKESNVPFNKYEVEISTSDKENEGICRHVAPELYRNTGVLESQPSTVKSSVVSRYSDDGSHTSTLKASQDLLMTGNTNPDSVNNVNASYSSQKNYIPSDNAEYSKASTMLPVEQKTKGNVDFKKRSENASTGIVNNKKHVRHDSYTLSQPSKALLQANVQIDVNSARNGQQNLQSNTQIQRNLGLEYDSRRHEKELMPSDVMEVEAEREGKAAHIQRYLSHVHEHSFNGSEPVDITPTKSSIENENVAPIDIGSTIKSFTSSLQSVDNLNEEELLKIQSDHFNKIRCKLIEQQRQQLEELFVSQRREQFHLQKEIEEYHEKLKQSQDLGYENSPENNAQYSTTVDNSQLEPFQIEKSRISQDTVQSSTSKPFSYVSSPSFYANPRDRDNNSDISTFSKGTPKQSLKFTSQVTPQTTPKIHKPVLRSPVKQPSLPQRSGRVSIPEKVFDPAMKPCFDRVSACVKGYLTRRLLKTEKVQEIIKTIQDTKNFAINFQTETPIKKGQFTHQDKDLLDRIIAQLQASLLDLHEIFFVIPVWERMSIISQSRQLHEERRLRESAVIRSSVSSSQPRISSATLKAMERKRKAHEAELAVFGDVRPVSAPPPIDNSQSMDLSGPIRRHFKFLLSRALRPLQGHSSGDSQRNQSSQPSARGKVRPKTAPEKSSKPTQNVEKQGGEKPRKVAKSGKNATKVTNGKSKAATTKTKTVVKSNSSSAWR